MQFASPRKYAGLALMIHLSSASILRIRQVLTCLAIISGIKNFVGGKKWDMSFAYCNAD
jgi:hypothetical protein